ncbi:MAG: hypothetical protein HDR86_03065 [Bacteroides sp.]|nr:hypothetical protein [Bacteroides sp.]
MERRIPIRRHVCEDCAFLSHEHEPERMRQIRIRLSIGSLTGLHGEGAKKPGLFREAFVAQPMERRIPIRRTRLRGLYIPGAWT